MKARLTVTIVLLVLALPATAAAGVTQSASGQGRLFIQTPDASGARTFSFNAETLSDGTTVGHAQLINRFNDTITHVRIDCLRVIGNVASMSGEVTSTNNPIFATFSEAVFSVQDNGEGANAPPDLISFAFFDLPLPGFDCQNQLFPPDMPILNGNVQVRG
jgi:hypothetical protein